MATTLTLEQMKQFVGSHFEEFVNKRNAAAIRRNMTSDFHDHDGPSGKPARWMAMSVLGMYKAMPDLHLTIEDMIAEGDKAVPQHLAAFSGRTSSVAREALRSVIDGRSSL
jgi:predicted ester cyclase